MKISCTKKTYPQFHPSYLYFRDQAKEKPDKFKGFGPRKAEYESLGPE